jgi:hypothetical protein
MYYLETAKGYTGKEIVLKAGNESTRYKRAPLSAPFYTLDFINKPLEYIISINCSGIFR